MPKLARAMLSISLATLLCSQSSSAFQSPLSDESVREAYFLGQRNNETTAAFFARYVRSLPAPESGPFVSEVEIYTPYTQVIERSRINSVGYSAQQARRDYRRRADSVFVRVRIDFTSTYGALELYRSSRSSENASREDRDRKDHPGDFGRDFRVGLTQKDQWVEPLSIQIAATYSPPIGHYAFLPPDGSAVRYSGAYGNAYYYHSGSTACALGWLVWLEFDAQDLASADSQVEVLTTDGQHVSVPFDLASLR